LLTREEQKGLIAELLVLERYLLPVLPTTEAIAAWRGPLGSAKDFIIGTTAIECKAHATGAPPVVVVSSEYQLDDVETPWLFLHVSTFETAEGLEEDGFTVTEIANRVRERLAGHDGPAEGQYAALLEAAGFRSGDDYTQARWRGGERGIYRVSDAFPRIIAKGLPSGVSHVKYALSLAQCAGYLVPSEQLGSAIRGPSHGE
jgi:hypothetical protein